MSQNAPICPKRLLEEILSLKPRRVKSREVEQRSRAEKKSREEEQRTSKVECEIRSLQYAA
jgi:hypothetical protein